MDAKTKAQLEQALSCTAIGPRFELAESLLKQSGWNPIKASRRSRSNRARQGLWVQRPQGSGVT